MQYLWSLVKVLIIIFLAIYSFGSTLQRKRQTSLAHFITDTKTKSTFLRSQTSCRGKTEGKRSEVFQSRSWFQALKYSMPQAAQYKQRLVSGELPPFELQLHFKTCLLLPQYWWAVNSENLVCGFPHCLPCWTTAPLSSWYRGEKFKPPTAFINKIETVRCALYYYENCIHFDAPESYFSSTHFHVHRNTQN